MATPMPMECCLSHLSLQSVPLTIYAGDVAVSNPATRAQLSKPRTEASAAAVMEGRPMPVWLLSEPPISATAGMALVLRHAVEGLLLRNFVPKDRRREIGDGSCECIECCINSKFFFIRVLRALVVLIW